MAEFRASFNSAGKVLTICAKCPSFVVFAEGSATTLPATCPFDAMFAKCAAATLSAKSPLDAVGALLVDVSLDWMRCWRQDDIR